MSDEYAVADHRHAELNVGGRTAGVYLAAIGSIIEDSADEEYVCDQCDHSEVDDPASMLEHLKTHDKQREEHPPRVEQLADFISQHTAARGVDLYATEVLGFSPAEWGRMTGRDRSTVSRNLRRTKE